MSKVCLRKCSCGALLPKPKLITATTPEQISSLEAKQSAMRTRIRSRRNRDDFVKCPYCGREKAK